ncbi:hypothetical protein CONCODRAFT_16775 [Conidiobolus coronatus NRRL 28638]|uniref:Serine hydrolase domain-containing protein n=1 Tax=Conidiobolus coronatus (strain ATCC 28846 / CBS 209.66 / NRRL 28638) TaxID=796925 RepID=A0A137P9J6_CONC2|nr:hypothetical protein CONCODRAFT_16775 [Conidiobolus coronatus NRRL 28638]|eukprot:KXN71669.1 hypothetical protein CONCODRAFT_16775 [Conidiobolus coronatus NRRL 28638]
MTIKILCLHGYGQNKVYFRDQLNVIKSRLGGSVEFITIDAPNFIPNVKKQAIYPKYSKKAKKLLDATGMKCWWNLENNNYIGLFDNTLPYINYIIEKYGPFNGILGFSQGACLTFILNGLIESKSPLINRAQPPLNFIVLSSGFFPRDPNIGQLIPLPTKTPTLNILDKEDKVVKSEYSLFLSNLILNNNNYVFHNNGHNMPNDYESAEKKSAPNRDRTCDLGVISTTL